MKRKCPSDGALIRLLTSGAADRRMESILDHLARCPRCCARFDVLHKLHLELEPEIRDFQSQHLGDGASVLLAAAARKRLAEMRSTRPASGPSPSPAASLLGPKTAAAALAVFLLVATGLFLSRFVLQPKSAARSQSSELTLLEPLGKVSAPPGTFKWTPLRHAESYSIRLTDSSLREIHAAGTFLITEIVIPPEVRSSLQEGETYVWEVRAVDGDSNVLAVRSGYFILE
jgi:hypothetical protein